MAYEYEVALKDGISVPAGSAAHQVDTLQKSMRGLQDQMIKSQALGDAKAFNKASEGYGKLQAQMKALAPAADKEISALKAAKKAEEEAASAAAAGTTETMGFGKAMSALGPEVKAVAIAVTAAIAAIVAFGYAIFAALRGVAKLTESRRQLLATFAAIEDGQKHTGALAAMLDKLGQKLPFTVEEMSKWALIMTNAGIKDIPTLESATKAAAASAAILGDESGAAGQKIADLHVQIADAIRLKQGLGDLTTMLRGTGTSAEDVARLMGITVQQLKNMAASGKNLKVIGAYIDESLIQKGKGAVINMSLTWDNLLKKAHENFATLFNGVADSPGFKAFLAALQNLLLIFSRQAGSGKAMQTGITGAFNAIFNVAAKVITWLHVKLLELATAAVRFYISLFPTLKTIKNLWNEYKGAEKLQLVLSGIGVVISLIAKGMWNLARPFVYAFGIAVAFGTAVLGVVGIVSKAWEAIGKKLGEWKDAAVKAAKDFITGLIDGISKGAKDVVSTVANLGKSSVSAFGDSIDAHSPSRDMMKMGGFMTTGAAHGIKLKSSELMDAANDAGEAAKVSFAGGAGGAAGGAAASSSSSSSVTIEAGAIVIYAQPGQSAAEIAEETLALLEERIALSRGLAA